MQNRYFLIGYMGSGKTTMGRIFAAQLGYEFIDLDHFIENRYHKTISQLFAEVGEERFREIEKECLHETGQFDKAVIATGGGAPCFFDNMDFMISNGLAIYIKMSPAQLVARLSATKTGTRPLIAGKSGEELHAFIKEALEKREPFYSRANMLVSGEDDYLEEWFRSYPQLVEK